MERKEMVNNIISLIKLDIDAVSAYEQAIEKVTDVAVQEILLQFKEDHERHIDSLNGELEKMNENLPKRSKDIKGFVLEGFTALRSASGTTGALEAMQSNEELTNREYKKATGWDMPEEIADIIQENYEDEQTHLEYINSTLTAESYT